ncbi:MAG: hypothetical protein KDB86_13760 [Actinobacteria bacterium]|nr:hypothetical protein [Actinomycetota bacterium]
MAHSWVRRDDIESPVRRVAAALMQRLLQITIWVRRKALKPVPDPRSDPFYEGVLELPRRGELIDTRPVQVRFLRTALRVDAWQLKFASSDRTDKPITGIATIIRHPTSVQTGRSERPTTQRPRLLVYQAAIDSLTPLGNPSYTLRRGDQLELPIMHMALRRGWTVLTVDWTGPQSSFADLESSGRLILDAISAAIDFEPAGLSSETPVALWGYSGGALATLFAAELQPSYAPNLKIVCAAAGGGGVDVASTPDMFESRTALSGIPFGACIAAARSFPEIQLDASLTETGRRYATAASDMTVDELALNFPFLKMSSILTVPTVLDVPGVRPALEAQRCGQHGPAAAMLLYHAIHDQATEIDDVDRLVAFYKASGVRVVYRRYRFGEHMIVMLRAIRPVLKYLSDQVDQSETAQES